MVADLFRNYISPIAINFGVIVVSCEGDQVCSVEILMDAGSESRSRFRKREKQKGLQRTGALLLYC